MPLVPHRVAEQKLNTHNRLVSFSRGELNALNYEVIAPIIRPMYVFSGLTIRRGSKNLRAFILLCVLFLATSIGVLGSSACGGPNQPGTEEPVQIGSLLAFTGDLADFGPPVRNAVDLASELINDGGGILGRRVRPVHKDSGTDPDTAIEAAKTLVEVNGVGAIVGPFASGVTQAVAEAITVPHQVVLVSPSATSIALTLMADNDFLFRTTVSDAAQGVVLARLAREQGFKSASGLYINNAYGEGLANVFRQSFEDGGGRVMELIPHTSGQISYLSTLRSAMEGNPDVLVSIGYPESAGRYLREALEWELADTFMFVDGNKSQEMFDALGPSNFDGSFGTAPGAPDSPAKRTFERLYRERFGELPTDPFLGEAFDAFILVALAIEKAGVNEGAAIRDALRSVANPPGEQVGPGDTERALDLIRSGQDIDYEGVAGPQNVDEYGDVSNTIEIWWIEEGEITSTGRFELP